MGLLSGTTSFKNYGLLGFGMNAAKAFNRPGTEGLSDAERRALDEAKADEDARRKRLSEATARRARVALGVQGGQRSLLGAGSYTGTPQTPPGTNSTTGGGA